MKKLMLVGAVVALMVGCSSAPKDKEKDEQMSAEMSALPSWVTMPVLEGGIADTACVKATSSMQLDRTEASTLARAELARQINVRAKVMDETYQRRTEAQGTQVTGNSFESVSSQVADQMLQGSRQLRADYVTIESARHFCVMVGIDPDMTETLFKRLMADSDRSVDSQSEQILFEEFKADQARQRLEAATQ